ncbi:hypothetical protein PNEG_01025 [Pneumocystis murina B123]|uniref:Endoplasmic reticulum transmembrane protein n=1 Tax=Pneumocystis murina (strain B123) TaxID=1069680 RepID=M7PKA1_PNEMU|nr:hypothetical protein PNEG_01025 [Pneumocystis murina B123]EMR10879.1 hypothetical protein PNEG_01025 [Pneumocystis murina B123]
MTLYYSLVFTLLVIQMVLFCFLILPLPKRLKRRLFTFISTSWFIAKIRYISKIIFIFILVLFFDSVNRVFRTVEEAKLGTSGSLRDAYRSDIQARKFYSQRNMYLCGFTLFLSLIIDRVYALTLQVLKYEELVNTIKTQSDEHVKSKALVEEITELKKRIVEKDKEFHELSERYSRETKTNESKKNM